MGNCVRNSEWEGERTGGSRRGIGDKQREHRQLDQQEKQGKRGGRWVGEGQGGRRKRRQELQKKQDHES